MRALVAFFAFLFQGVLSELVVQLPNGKLQGTTFDTPSGQKFYAWRGIPFAKPPTGKLRFLPPVKAEPWEGIRDASEDSPACIAFGAFPGDPNPINGNSEDCLYLNVYSPVAVDSNSSVNPARAVLVWIYGGGFMSGFSDFGFYDPTPFLEDDIVFVSLNYRLSTLGFLSTEDDVVLGNAGLKDQSLALQWVKDNIAFFGGNPQKVTIFGESAGAMSVGYHVVSPMSRNLFNGAIMQSGSSISSFFQSNPRQFALTLASKIDDSITNTSSSEQIRDVLQIAPTQLIIDLTSDSQIMAVIEVKSNLSFLSEPLYEAVESGNIAKVPVIIGFNSEESITFGGAQLAPNYDSNPELLVPTNFKLKENVTAQTVAELIHDQYAGKDVLFADNLLAFLEGAGVLKEGGTVVPLKKILTRRAFLISVKEQPTEKEGQLLRAKTVEICVEEGQIIHSTTYYSDTTFLRSSHKQAVLQSKYSPVYMYQFSYYGTLSKDNLIVPGAGKVGHAQEVGYQFNVSTKAIETDKDYLTRKRFVKLWTNFAKTSNPTPDDDSAELLQHVKWEPISENDVHYLDVDEDLQIKPTRKHNESIFWDDIWKTYSYRPYNTY